MTNTMITQISWILIDLLVSYALFNVYMSYKKNQKVQYGELTESGLCLKYFEKTHTHVEKVIKKIMICLENDDLEKAKILIVKVNKISPDDSNVILLTSIIEQSTSMHYEEVYENVSYQ